MKDKITIAWGTRPHTSGLFLRTLVSLVGLVTIEWYMCIFWPG